MNVSESCSKLLGLKELADSYKHISLQNHDTINNINNKITKSAKLT
jgi:hypothetical protein